MSLFTPKFLSSLEDPAIDSVFLTGCGGGFDFVHSLCLVPEIKRLGKTFVIGSYSFGDPQLIDAEIVDFHITVKKVYSYSKCSQNYCPEVAICQFLDRELPESSPHFIYAYYARDFSVPELRELYSWIISTHRINGIALFDGGSDSLMKGDESGLGDPIEDAVSLAAVSSIPSFQVPYKVLITIGLGSDRFNNVSDAASLRAISELTKKGGFLGSVSLEQGSSPFDFYQRAVSFIYSKQQFRSVLAGSILASASGDWGDKQIPEQLVGRVQKGSLFIWPLMSFLWAFDVNVVDDRSLVTKWIRNSKNVKLCHEDFYRERRKLERNQEVLLPEELPLFKDFCCEGVFNRRDGRINEDAQDRFSEEDRIGVDSGKCFR